MSSLAGSFLVARPSLQDPNFLQTVVLLLRHSSDGAFGLVVNRPTETEDFPFLLFTGGPCPAPGLIMLHDQPEWISTSEEDETPVHEVAPGIYVGDGECVRRATEDPDCTQHFRMFAGYAGWGPDQLEGELAAGAWFVAPASSELLFQTPVEDLWDRLSPPGLPQPSLN